MSREPANEGSRRYTYTRDTQGDPGRRGVRVRKKLTVHNAHTQHEHTHSRERETQRTPQRHTPTRMVELGVVEWWTCILGRAYAHTDRERASAHTHGCMCAEGHEAPQISVA